MPLLPMVSVVLHDVEIELDGHLILNNINLAVHDRARVALVGPNGVGKSTLLRALTGQLEPTQGRIERLPNDLQVGFMTQEPRRAEQQLATVADAVAHRCGITQADANLEAATVALASAEPGADDRYQAALDRWTELDVAGFDQRLVASAEAFGWSPSRLTQPPSQLSGGEWARLAMIALDVGQWHMLALDEPSNHLDREGRAQLDELIANFAGPIVLVSHDRQLSVRHVTAVFELDAHTRTGSMFHGGWTAYLDERAHQHDLAQQRYDTYVGERDRLQRRSQQQREWADQGRSKAIKKPKDGDKHIRNRAIAASERLQAKATASARAAERLEVVDAPWQGWDLHLTIAEAGRGPDTVVSLHDILVERGDFRLGPITERIDRGERVHLIGPNGAGKSTLVDIITGQLDPTQGRVDKSPQVIIGELDQRRGIVNNVGSLTEAVTVRTGLTTQEARSLLAKFGLGAGHVELDPSVLSPGERTRLQLAIFQARGVNLLILDEPTNHLDLEAVEQLESALESYAGSVLLISHDESLVANLDINRTWELP